MFIIIIIIIVVVVVLVVTIITLNTVSSVCSEVTLIGWHDVKNQELTVSAQNFVTELKHKIYTHSPMFTPSGEVPIQKPYP